MSHHHRCAACESTVKPMESFCSSCGRALMWDSVSVERRSDDRYRYTVGLVDGVKA